MTAVGAEIIKFRDTLQAAVIRLCDVQRLYFMPRKGFLTFFWYCHLIIITRARLDIPIMAEKRDRKVRIQRAILSF